MADIKDRVRDILSRPDVNIAYKPGVSNNIKFSTAKKRAPVSISSIQKGFDKVAPYVSNLVNAVRKAPSPNSPNLVKAASLTSPSLAAERTGIDESVRAANVGADNSLDSNTAAAVKGGILAQGLRAKSQSYANEAGLKVQTQNQAASLNANVDAINAGKLDQYNEQQIGMKIANEREQSGNIANAADKYVQDVARKDQMNLDKTKFSIMSKMYGSGVLDRLVRGVLNKGDKDTLTDDDYGSVLGVKRMNGGKLRYADGGSLKPGDKAYYDRMKTIPKATITGPSYTSAPGHTVDSTEYNRNFSNGLVYGDATAQEQINTLSAAVSSANPSVSNFAWDKYHALSEGNTSKNKFDSDTVDNTVKTMYLGKRSYKPIKAFGGPIGPGDEDKNSPAYQAKLATANIEAKRFATARGLVSGENTHVGPTLPRYVDAATGKDYVPTQGTKPTMNVPNWVSPGDIQSKDGYYWYEDRDTGKLTDIDPNVVLNNPRFKGTFATAANATQVSMQNSAMKSTDMASIPSATSLIKPAPLLRSNGGGIHINPANRGKFNATKAATGKSTEELTHSSNPITKKRAVFAQNASHWSHAKGGYLGGSIMHTPLLKRTRQIKTTY